MKNWRLSRLIITIRWQMEKWKKTYAARCCRRIHIWMNNVSSFPFWCILFRFPRAGRIRSTKIWKGLILGELEQALDLFIFIFARKRLLFSKSNYRWFANHSCFRYFPFQCLLLLQTRSWYSVPSREFENQKAFGASAPLFVPFRSSFFYYVV